MAPGLYPTDASEEEDEVDAGTQKPMIKGRKMYYSKKVLLAEYAQIDGGYALFRANVEASFRKNDTR